RRGVDVGFDIFRPLGIDQCRIRYLRAVGGPCEVANRISMCSNLACLTDRIDGQYIDSTLFRAVGYESNRSAVGGPNRSPVVLTGPGQPAGLTAVPRTYPELGCGFLGRLIVGHQRIDDSRAVRRQLWITC